MEQQTPPQEFYEAQIPHPSERDKVPRDDNSTSLPVSSEKSRNILGLLDTIKLAFNKLRTNEAVGYFVKVYLSSMLLMLPLIFLFFIMYIFLLVPQLVNYQKLGGNNLDGKNFPMGLNEQRVDDSFLPPNVPINENSPPMDVFTVLSDSMSQDPSSLGVQDPTFIGVFVLAFLFLLILFSFYTVYISVLYLKATIDIHDGTYMRMRELLRFSFSRMFPMLFLSSIMAILSVIGIIFFVIPGLIFITMYIFAPIILVKDNVGPLEALSRSARLTKGYRLNLFLKGVGFVFINLLLAVPLIMFIYMTGAIISILYFAFYYLILIVLYTNLLEIKSNNSSNSMSIANL